MRIAAKDLTIHPVAQREIIPSKLKKLIAELDLDAISVVDVVSYHIPGHGDGPFVVDGQHRITALMEHGLGDWIVEAMLHENITTDAGSCALFLKLNDRAAVNTYAKYLNELAAGSPLAVGVDAALKHHKLKAARTSADGHVAAVSSMKNIFSWDEGKTLDEGLSMVLEAWGDRAAALEGKVIEGICRVVFLYNGKLDTQAFTKTISKYRGGPSAMLGSARGLMDTHKAGLSRCVANVALNAYNAGRRAGRLDRIGD
jgi:hypothetical protein